MVGGTTPNRGQSGNGTPGSYAVATRPETGTMLAEHAPAAFTYADDPMLAPGVTEDDRTYYKHHHCEQLAWAVHEATGWPYTAVVDDYSEEFDGYGWMHLAVMAPNGQVFDVEGPTDVDDILDQYGDCSEAEDGDSWLVEDVQPRQVHLKPQEWSPTDVERAQRVADAVLAQYHRG